MMGSPIFYAKSGGPPDDWEGLEIIDLDSSAFVPDVEECNVAEGWLVRAKRNADGQLYADGGDFARERLTGRFAIVRPKRPRIDL